MLCFNTTTYLMDKGDLIQLGLTILVFLIFIALIYLYITMPLWTAISATMMVAVVAYIASRFIK